MPMTPDVGGEVDSICGRCKDTTLHIVLAKVDDVIARAQCKRCGAQHRYRSPDGKKKKTSTKSKSAGASTSTSRSRKRTKEPELPTPRVEFDPDVSPRPYRMTERFAPGERMDHVKFGIGVVEKEIGPNKIEVCFKDARRTLRQAKP